MLRTFAVGLRFAVGATFAALDGCGSASTSASAGDATAPPQPGDGTAPTPEDDGEHRGDDAASAASPDAAHAGDAADVADALSEDETPFDPCGPPMAVWQRCSSNPLAVAGAMHSNGDYELSIGDPDVQYDAWDQTWRAWWSTSLAPTYTAPNPVLAIKYAESADGVRWNIQDAPVLSSHVAAGDWDWSKAETPSAIYVPANPPDRRWMLYYSGGNDSVKTGPGASTWYQIGLAFSADGKNFTRLPASESPYAGVTTPYANIAGLVLLGRDAFPGMANVVDGVVADPEIVRDDAGVFHLFFSSLAVDSSNNPLAYGVSHATSTDGIHFTAQRGNPIPALSGGAGPSVVRSLVRSPTSGNGYELYFYRDSDAEKATVPTTFNPELGVWRATSSDLSSWTVPSAERDFAWDGTVDYEKYGWLATGDMAWGAPFHRWYYVAFSDQNPPAGWVTPTHTGNVPAVIALSTAEKQ